MVATDDKALWAGLSASRERVSAAGLAGLFEAEPDRGPAWTLEHDGLTVDLSKNLIDREALDLLVSWAHEQGLPAEIQAMCAGAHINTSEDRAVLHTALRLPREASLVVDGVEVVAQVHAVLDRMAAFADQVRSQAWLGWDGQPISDVVNIGIGGSDLGPQMAVQALAPYGHPRLRMHFVSDVDAHHLHHLLDSLEPTRTLFIVASKTFTTSETLTNARTARAWLLDGLGDSGATARHFVAVSTNTKAVSEFGIDPANMFEFWDWVGGRYSLMSAIGLPLMIAIGPTAFTDLLAGAHAMDRHFQTAELTENLPVLLGLLGVWNRNVLELDTQAILPYDGRLARLPAYLQQLEMESNGKSVTRDGDPVPAPTCPIVWGETGINGQHAFFQLLHQGTTVVPCDFLGVLQPHHALTHHHDLVMANMFAQTAALAFGRASVGDADPNLGGERERHRVFSGNRPTTTILLPTLDPYRLGQLIALYEHKTFTQGVIWQVNSFDQWGVELGKKLAARVHEDLLAEAPAPRHDSSTSHLIDRYRQVRASTVV